MFFYVYMLAAKKNGPLYVGLVCRAYEHRNGLVEGFTKRHGVKSLLYF
jgi:putative endonuclease